MLSGLIIALTDAETAADVRCVVLTGAGGAFCAGGDVKEFAEGGGAAAGSTSWDEGVHGQRLSHRDTSGALFEMPKPTVAVLPGPAAGAGLSLALACDLRTILDLESTHHRHTARTKDHLEASKAFVDKRQPQFEGR
jgi:2-(1,2-epoxy-1,2-dihydrophenyl)acetyl-CoA isomerase